jgi:hypothetical protein
MSSIETSIDIEAPAGVVWNVLTDFAAYPEWNPFIVSAAGELTLGSQLVVRIAPEGSRPMTFKPSVVRLEHEREFEWLGHLLVRGLFDGRHCFHLEPLAADATRFHHSEYFRGLLAPVLTKALGSSTRAGFEAMNRELKSRSESVHQSRSLQPTP